ncbi:MAG: DUF308 domain-containing protein [Myxococcales bacterium]
MDVIEYRFTAREIEGHRRSRPMLVLRGILAAILGLLALAFPSKTLGTVIAFVGAYLLVDGAFALITAVIHLFKKNESAWPYLFDGVLSVAVGVLALGKPAAFAVGALFLLAVRCLGTGVAEIAAGRMFSRETGAAEWPFWIAGGASLAFGILLLLNPTGGLLALVWLLGIYGLVFGIALFGSALKMPSGAMHPPLTHARG